MDNSSAAQFRPDSGPSLPDPVPAPGSIPVPGVAIVAAVLGIVGIVPLFQFVGVSLLMAEDGGAGDAVMAFVMPSLLVLLFIGAILLLCRSGWLPLVIAGGMTAIVVIAPAVGAESAGASSVVMTLWTAACPAAAAASAASPAARRWVPCVAALRSRADPQHG